MTVGLADGDESTLLDPGLAASTSYHYRVIAFNTAGDSPASTQVAEGFYLGKGIIY